ncbi:MAG TPA: acyltransferase [Cyanobacteria bacterium UBA8803]|nr:acyltransferase [Cyanobacteria bacterium UBA9273]HBL61161.1 acyltransferase [Cyanobacteria bacterium UBA8803]
MNEIKNRENINENYSNRLDILLALRGFACFMVMISHLNPPRDSIIYKGYDLSWLLFSDGKVAVWIFFCLSGYLMGKAFYTERYTGDTLGLIKFWRNRILRIVPLYYFSVLVCILFVDPNFLKTENWGYLIRILTFTSYLGLPTVNGVLWSLSTEMHFYACVPFIYNFLKYRLFGKINIIVGALFILSISFILRLAVWIIFYKQVHENIIYLMKYWYSPVIMNLDLFLCGFLVNALLAYRKYTNDDLNSINNNGKKKFGFAILSPQIIALVLMASLYLFTAHHKYNQELHGLLDPARGVRTSTTFFILPLLTALITSFFIFVFESNSYNEFRKIKNLSFAAILKNPFRTLEIFGILSYGIYIWHQQIIIKIAPIFVGQIPIESFYARFTATLILSTLFSAVTYYLVELPAIRLKVKEKS